MNGKSLDDLSRSFGIIQDHLEKLKQLFPEAITEGKIDWEKLQATLGKENLEFRNERYVLNWAGKTDAFKVLQQSTTATLKPCPGEGINDGFSSPLGGGQEGASENVFIEGENLEVLKVLQKAYYGKIKCIIIDPPYNTGNDSFIYPDSFKESKADYEKRIGDKDEEGYLLKEGYFRKNSKDSGHYHSNWLSMMYPRLFLAKNLLRDDGVIFVHIDDNEVHNLRLIMNEIFGEENFLAELVWNLRSGSQAGHFTGSHEYILSFAKVKEKLKYFSDSNGGTIKHGALKKISKDNPESDITFPIGIEFEGDNAEFEGEIGGSEKEYIRNSKMIFENGKLKQPVSIGAGWAMRNQIISWLNGEETFDSKGQKVLKFYFNSQGILWYEKERGTIHPKTVLPDEVGNTKTGTDEIIRLFGKKIMDFPKPYQLVKFLIDVICEKQDLVLDFFAGSGTTAQAVLEQNKEDGGNRKFILVQLPEKCDEESESYKAGYKTIADIGKERIRRVINKLKIDNEKFKIKTESELELTTNNLPPTTDLGFKVFKLSSSNFKIWRGNEITEENLEQQLDAFTNPVKEGSEKENMLYELILKAGYLLTDKVETISFPFGEGRDGAYYSVNHGELIIALEEMNQELIDTVILAKPKKVITLDKLFMGNDQLKTNTVLQMRVAEIDFRTI